MQTPNNYEIPIHKKYSTKTQVFSLFSNTRLGRRPLVLKAFAQCFKSFITGAQINIYTIIAAQYCCVFFVRGFGMLKSVCFLPCGHGPLLFVLFLMFHSGSFM